MEIHVGRIGRYTVLTPGSQLDQYSRTDLQKVVEDEIERGIRYVAIDMCNIDFLNSSGITCLAMCAKKMRECGGELCLLHLADEAMQILKFGGIESYFQITTPDVLIRST